MHQKASIYIHIPFCKAKCNYCDFVSFSTNIELHHEYIKALVNEISSVKELFDSEIETIFIGGGTPSIIEEGLFFDIFDAIYKYKVSSSAEITIEANPESLTEEKLKVYKSIGINRLSIGLQAWQQLILKDLGRIHDRESFLKAYNAAVKHGFTNINVDIMFALPGQSLRELQETVDNVIDLNPAHISAYALIIEEGTPFYTKAEENALTLPDDTLDREMYHYLTSALPKQGYAQYEISNFAKAGYECRHNIVYWTRKPYLGFGLNAHSFFCGNRFNNISNLESYINLNGIPSLVRENVINVSDKEAMEEFMFLGLRMTAGVLPSDFKKAFGVSIYQIYGEKIKKLTANGLLEERADRIFLSKKGLDLANMVFSEFLI